MTGGKYTSSPARHHESAKPQRILWLNKGATMLLVARNCGT